MYHFMVPGPMPPLPPQSPLPLREGAEALFCLLATEAVSAGFPSPADDYVEARIDLNLELIPRPLSTFFMRVSGDAMRGDGIVDGDLLVIDRSVDPGPAWWWWRCMPAPSCCAVWPGAAMGCGWWPATAPVRPWCSAATGAARWEATAVAPNSGAS